VIELKYLLICDLDDTITGDKEGLRRFNKILSSNKFCLVYSSGRFKESIISLIEESILVKPDVLIANLGTEIYYAPDWKKDEDWENLVKKSWNKEKIISILDGFDLLPQPYRKKYVLPYYSEKESILGKVKNKVEICSAKVVYSGSRYLDILPNNAGKGKAAKYLGKKFSMPIICCGDSENDEDMLKKSDYGILVGNAPVHLRREMLKYCQVYVAKSFYAMGIIEGLLYHGFISKKGTVI
jgi:sucrose-6F-phosphate phosphohydrolase